MNNPSEKSNLYQKKKLIKKKKMLSILSLFALSAGLLTNIPEFLHATIWVSLARLATLTPYAFVFLINRWDYTTQASTFFQVYTGLLIFFFSDFLPAETYTYLYFFPLLIGTPFFIEKEKKAKYGFHIILPIFYLFVLFFFDFNLTPINIISVNPELIGTINIFAAIVMVAFINYQLVVDVVENEKEVKFSERILRKQNNELVKVNKELDRFVYSVGHDLRAPISSVLGLVELSKDEKDLHQLKEYNQLQEQSLKKLDGYIKDILTFSRNARVSPANEEINFKTFVETCFEEVKFAQEKEMEFSVDSNQTKPFYSDKMRVSAILNNLISNSVRYLDKQKEISRLSVSINIANQQAVIVIKDNGIGISDEHLPKIFDMFYRASYESVGTGLGLFIVKEMTEKLNGQIEVESQEGIYTQFKLTIPENKGQSQTA